MFYKPQVHLARTGSSEKGEEGEAVEKEQASGSGTNPWPFNGITMHMNKAYYGASVTV